MSERRPCEKAFENIKADRSKKCRVGSNSLLVTGSPLQTLLSYHEMCVLLLVAWRLGICPQVSPQPPDAQDCPDVSRVYVERQTMRRVSLNLTGRVTGCLGSSWGSKRFCSVLRPESAGDGNTILFVKCIGDIVICFIPRGRRACAIIYWSFSFMKFSNGRSGIFLTERLWFLNTGNKVVMSFSSRAFYCLLFLCWYYFFSPCPHTPTRTDLHFYFPHLSHVSGQLDSSSRTHPMLLRNGCPPILHPRKQPASCSQCHEIFTVNLSV